MVTAKQIWEAWSEDKRQDLALNITRNDLYLCQSSLVDELFKKEVFSMDDIENLYAPTEDNPEETEPQEIFEWWAVSEWLAIKLYDQHEPLIKNEYGTWWGRTCTGQSVYLDYCIQMVAAQLEADIQNDVARLRAVGL